MSDEIEITVSVNIGLVGCNRSETLSMLRDEWEDMTEDEREDCCKEVMFDLIEWNYEVQA